MGASRTTCDGCGASIPWPRPGEPYRCGACKRAIGTKPFHKVDERIAADHEMDQAIKRVRAENTDNHQRDLDARQRRGKGAPDKRSRKRYRRP